MVKFSGEVAHNQVKELRCKVFRSTVDISRKGYYKVNGVEIKIRDVEKMVSNTVFYSKESEQMTDGPVLGDTIFEIVNEDCLKVAEHLVEMGENPAVLNMASRRNPGGGVVNGAGAQEETVFRRSNIFQSLYQFARYAEQYGVRKNRKQYPLDRNFGGIYSPYVTVFREAEENGYELKSIPFQVSFISVAGLNRPDIIDDNWIPYIQAQGLKNKIRTILSLSLKHGHTTLILGALGCGAFHNPPLHVAILFREVFEETEFKGKFKKIIFAILEDHNSHKRHNPEGNIYPFKRVFEENVSMRQFDYSKYIKDSFKREFKSLGVCVHAEAFGADHMWSLYSDGTLRISGNGPIPDFINHWHAYTGEGQAPWVGCDRYGVTPSRLVIDEGITKIGENAFESFRCLESVSLPETLTTVGRECFFECFNIKIINVPRTIQTEVFRITGLPMYATGKYSIIDNIMIFNPTA